MVCVSDSGAVFDQVLYHSPTLRERQTLVERDGMVAPLTEAHKAFLLGLVAAAPDWSLMPFPHLSQLPAIQWKLQNLARLRKSNPAKFRAQAEELRQRF